MLPNANRSCKILDSLSTELHALYYLKDEYPRSMWWCFGVGEINPCSTKVTALIRSTEIFIMGLWYRAFQLVFYFLRAHGATEYLFLWNTGIAMPIITQIRCTVWADWG